jgi:hypothetical protein
MSFIYIARTNIFHFNLQLASLMCIGLCFIMINEEEPTRCYIVFYYTYNRLNMFPAALCPSSGAHDYISDYHTDRLILRLLMAGGYVQVGWLSVRAELEPRQ